MSKQSCFALFIVAFLGALLFCGCDSGKAKLTTRHISDSLFLQINERYHSLPQQESRKSLDSLYKTFPFISAIDEYRYYELVRNIYYDAHISAPDLPDTSMYYTDRMIEILEEAGVTRELHREYVEALQKKSALLTEAKRYEEAVELLAKCIMLNKEAGKFDMVCENLAASAYVANSQRKYDVAIQRFLQALELVKYHQGGMLFYRTQRTLDDLGVVYRSIHRYDSAIYWHMKAAVFILDSTGKNEIDNKGRYVSLQNVYENVAQNYLSLDSINKARYYIDSAIKVAEKCQLADGELYRLYQTSARISYSEKKIDEADSLNQKARSRYAVLGNGYKMRLLALQSEIDSIKGRDKSRADNLYQLYLLKDSIDNDVIEVLKKDPQVVYEQLAKRHQISLLEAKSKLQGIYLIAAVIITILLILLALAIFRNLKRSKRLNNSLLMREKELQKLLAEIAEQKEEEKKQELFFQQLKLQDEFAIVIKQQKQKISDDMHDELTSSLAALKYYLNDLSLSSGDASLKKILSDLEEEVATIYTNARQYMHNLRSQASRNDYDLPGFLQDISRKFTEKGLVQISIEIDESKINTLLSSDQYDNLYFIIKESLSNVIKHSKAKNATVSIVFTDSVCEFTIKDDGRGANMDAVKSGLGLNSIKSRVQYLQGKISFTSESGMIIKGEFPFKNFKKEGDKEFSLKKE